MHYISLINGMSNAQADDLMSFATDLLDGSSGIVASTDYAVAQSSPVAMSVTVGTGKAYIYISSLTSYYRTLLDAAVTLSIAANSSGSTRIDTICIKVDTGATPDADASNVATVVVVQGTPGAGAPATPANHYKLAEVTVANGAVSIVTANIADSRVQLNIRTGTKVGGVTPGAATDAAITFTDVTTNDASTSKHGFLRKLSNVATQFMNGVGAWVDGVAADGWTLANETWTYASATTLTVSGDVTNKYQVGDKIRLTQTTVKYFVIIALSYSAPNTTITIFGGTSYTFTNASVSNNYYSKSVDPYGFPTFFAMTPPTFSRSGTGFTNAPTSVIANIAFKGRMAMLMVQGLFGNPSGGTGYIYASIVPPALNDSCAMTGGINISTVKVYSVHHDTTKFVAALTDGGAITDSNVYFRFFMYYQMV